MESVSENERSEPKLVELYARRPTPGELLDLLPWDGKYGRYNLVVCHKLRRKIIMIKNKLKHERAPGVVFVPYDPKVPESTDLHLAEGTELIACDSEISLGIYNAGFYSVVSVSLKSVFLDPRPP